MQNTFLVIFAHASLGIIISWFIIFLLKSSQKKLSPVNEMLIWSAGAIGAIFPDADLLYIFFVDSSINHRVLISHSIIPYLFIAFGTLIIFKLLNSKKIEYLIMFAFLFGILSHLLTDMIMGPVYFFKPFVNKEFVWDPYPTPEGSNLLNYIFSPYMMFEIVIILLSIILLIRNLSPHKKEFRLILYLLGTIQIGVWIALIPFAN